ncbi:hypothetical protein [Paraconexibacter sp.]|uniref:hypothetical protein n=1 Tax=Paraconexibacter sp. TaxID=2949640 RepID=UPI003565D775
MEPSDLSDRVAGQRRGARTVIGLVLAAATLIVLWPRLASDPPTLPDARPVAIGYARTATTEDIAVPSATVASASTAAPRDPAAAAARAPSPGGVMDLHADRREAPAATRRRGRRAKRSREASRPRTRRPAARRGRQRTGPPSPAPGPQVRPRPRAPGPMWSPRARGRSRDVSLLP